MPEGFHPDDMLHVILDGLAALSDRIEGRTRSDIYERPWEHYAGDDDDPKLSRDGYVAVLAMADDRITAMLSKSVPLPEVPEWPRPG